MPWRAVHLRRLACAERRRCMTGWVCGGGGADAPHPKPGPAACGPAPSVHQTAAQGPGQENRMRCAGQKTLSRATLSNSEPTRSLIHGVQIKLVVAHIYRDRATLCPQSSAESSRKTAEAPRPSFEGLLWILVAQEEADLSCETVRSLSDRLRETYRKTAEAPRPSFGGLL